MYIITYLRDVLVMKKVLAIALILFGFLCLLQNLFVAFLCFGIGINLISTDGSQIDLENKTYRNIKAIFGFKFGTWKPIPQFEYVSIFKTKESTEITARGATIRTIKNDVILLNLFYQGNKHITFYKTEDKEDALKVANHFKLALDVAILDATTTEKKWL